MYFYWMESNISLTGTTVDGQRYFVCVPLTYTGQIKTYSFVTASDGYFTVLLSNYTVHHAQLYSGYTVTKLGCLLQYGNKQRLDQNICVVYMNVQGAYQNVHLVHRYIQLAYHHIA